MVAVLLHNPKFAKNVGGALRSCAAFEADALYWTGERVLEPEHAKQVKRYARLPRELRMHDYKETVQFKRLSLAEETDIWRRGSVLERQIVTPVAVEFRDTYEQLPYFEHPEHALYVFGAEDGSVPIRNYHRYVTIPAEHCLNLAVAVSVVLYDRQAKLRKRPR